MIPFVTVKKMKKLDKSMIKDFNISLMQMMENTGIRLAEFTRSLMGGVHRKRIAVFCGPGNNGGGGLAAARQLHNYGAKVAVVLAKKNLKKAPENQLKILENLDLKTINYSSKNENEIKGLLSETDMIIDALVGYSLKGNPKGNIKKLVEMINDSDKRIISLDVPTGLDATKGKAKEPCVKADYTLALALPKKGLVKRKFRGKLFLANISVPDELYKKINIKASKNTFKDRDIIKL